MLFITNRIPASPDPLISKADRPLSFSDTDSDAANSLFYCRANEDTTITELTSKGFFAVLGASQKPNVLLYIHGYSTEFSKAIGKGFSLQALVDKIVPGKIDVVTLVWPCTGDVTTTPDGDTPNRALEYWNDEDAADMSGPVFGRMLSRFVFRQAYLAEGQAACRKRIHVLAHSMGNRVLVNTLTGWGNSLGGGGVPLLCRNIFLVAADIPSTDLEFDQPGYLISLAARNVVVYHAADDRRMEESIVANTFRIGFRGCLDTTARLGDLGPQDPGKTRKNVFRINCDAFNEAFDTEEREDKEGRKVKMKVGHGYFLTKKPDTQKIDNAGGAGPQIQWPAYQVDGEISPALYHIVETIVTDQVPKVVKRQLDLPADYIYPPAAAPALVDHGEKRPGEAGNQAPQAAPLA